ncbi:hypothetical protein GPECTOR_25g440 [Gonium pectorale]|uniref:Uncharacterized protein n=1 Tax=Gonium pectorale TaxID=33097 RepID=A0A150GGU8_GONPE|nr:hypothetical protein GPECTOR_25g440 [Gonium pectorale]|eukprot:KXZ48855.1 hypothetical protein GPECTOR_25g440 [Gonium pectorale]
MEMAALLKTIDGFGENVQACRLPYSLNGIVLDKDICPGSITSTPVYVNADSSSERAIGTLITFRTSAGWLVSTVRLDCPWLAWFSYNGKMPATSVAPTAAGLNSTANSSAIVNGGRRMLVGGHAVTSAATRRRAASSNTATTICPSLTTDGQVLYGNGNGQYQNGRPDVRSTLSVTYTGSKGAVFQQVPMFRYQNNGDGSNNNEDNGGDGWYSCYTFMHQMDKIASTCEKVKNALVSLTLPLVFKVTSDGARCPPLLTGDACAAGTVPLTWYSRRQNRVVAVQCIDAPIIDNVTSALVLPICWRRACVGLGAAIDADDVELTAVNVTLPAAFQQSSVGIALTLLRPSCAAEAWAEGFPVQEDKYNSLLFNEADTVTTPGGGLSKFTAHLLAPPFCDDRSAVFMLNVMAVQLVDTVYNMCPKHAIPDKSNGNADCPAGKVMVFLDITDGTWNKNYNFSTVKQCVDPANYDMFGGEMAISYCWSFGQLPDQFAINPFMIRMPNVTDYNIGRMPGGEWDTKVNQPIGRGVTTTLVIHFNSEPDMRISTTAKYKLPSTGVKSLDLEILVPVGLDDQSVSVQMFGPPNPPPPSEICPCPNAVPADGICPGNTAKLTASLVANPNVTQEGCVPSPYWDGVVGELMFSHCWRYMCLSDKFQKQDYFLDLEFTEKYNVQNVPAGQHRLDWFKPKIVDMFLRFKYFDQPNPDDFAQYSSRNGQSQTIWIPPGGIRQMGVRFKIPYNMIYDTNSGSVNLNTNPKRLLVPPPPPLPLTNYSYTINRTGTVMKSSIFVRDVVNASEVNTTVVGEKFSVDLQDTFHQYIMTSDVSFPDFGLVKSCTPADVQAVLDQVARKYGISADSMSASCQYNYLKPTSTGSTATSGRRRLTTTGNATVCRPRVTISIAMPLDIPVDGNGTAALVAATDAANAMYKALGGDACYVPTGSENTVGTLVTFRTYEPKATCEYLLMAFASANNLTADQVRTFDCGSYTPKKRYPQGMIALWAVVGFLGLIIILVLFFVLLAWRRRRAANLQFVNQMGGLSGGTSAPNQHKVVPEDPYGHNPNYARHPVSEGLERPDSPNRHFYQPTGLFHHHGAVPPVSVNRVFPV